MTDSTSMYREPLGRPTEPAEELQADMKKASSEVEEMGIFNLEPENMTPEPIQKKEAGEKAKPRKFPERIYTAIGLISLSAVLALAGCSEKTSAATRTATPIAIVEPTPTVTPEQTPTYEQQVAALEIPVGMSAEELAKILVEDRWTKWANASVSTKAEGDTFHNEWSDYADANGATSEDRDAFRALRVNENAKAFTDALFVENWEEVPELDKFLDRKQRTNRIVLKNYMATAWTGDPEDKEPYREWFTVDSVEETYTDDSQRTLIITFTQHNNADMNSVPDVAENWGGAQTYVVTLCKDDNNTEKICNAEVYDTK